MKGSAAQGILKQFIPDGVCVRCRGCCRFHEKVSNWSPNLLSEEQRQLGLPGVKFTLVAGNAEDGFLCPQLQLPGNTCGIYAHRPLDCQLYPFVLNRRGTEVFLSLDPQCPYIFEHQKDTVVTEYAQYLLRYVQQAHVRLRLQENPQLIQSYSGVIDLHTISL